MDDIELCLLSLAIMELEKTATIYEHLFKSYSNNWYIAIAFGTKVYTHIKENDEDDIDDKLAKAFSSCNPNDLYARAYTIYITNSEEIMRLLKVEGLRYKEHHKLMELVFKIKL
jgi:hypothetical protein